MQELVELIGKSLADNPEHVRVEAEDKGYETLYTIYVAPADMGRLIGKGGRIAKAIRTVVKASAIKAGVQVHVKIDEAH
ncbi:MAG TPA: KH domain-containing protein [Firmicutes bacterium]|nr:KH domain-containing protein [Bacillota bacterium]